MTSAAVQDVCPLLLPCSPSKNVYEGYISCGVSRSDAVVSLKLFHLPLIASLLIFECSASESQNEDYRISITIPPSGEIKDARLAFLVLHGRKWVELLTTPTACVQFHKLELI